MALSPLQKKKLFRNALGVCTTLEMYMFAPTNMIDFQNHESFWTELEITEILNDNILC